MDSRATHDHPAAVLVDRIAGQARAELEGTGRSVSDRATALFSSMFSIVILCDETLLEYNVLRKITFEDDSWTFAQRLFVGWEGEDVVPGNVAQLLRFLRNSLAHGNVNLDPSVELARTHEHGVTFELPFNPEYVVSSDFYAIIVWENQPGKAVHKSAATLSIANMWLMITQLQALVHDKRNWKHRARQWAVED